MQKDLVETIKGEKFDKLSTELGCKTSLQVTALRWFIYCIVNDFRDEYIEDHSSLKIEEIYNLSDEVEKIGDKFENSMCSLVCDYSYDELGSILQKSLNYGGSLRYRIDKYLSEYKVYED
jgi:hypothetical protein